MPETSLDSPLAAPTATAGELRSTLDSVSLAPSEAWKGQVQSRLQEYRQRRASRLGQPVDGEAPNIIPFKRRPRGLSLAPVTTVEVGPEATELAEPVIPLPRPRPDFAAGASYQQIIRPELAAAGIETPSEPVGSADSNLRNVSAATAETVAEAAQLAAALAVALGRSARPLRPLMAAPLPEDEIAEPVLPKARERYSVPVAAPRVYAAGENPRLEIPLLAAPTACDPGVAGIELPLPVASPWRRLAAGAIDAGYVLAPGALFAASAAMLLGLPVFDRAFLHRCLPAAGLTLSVFAVLFILLCGHLGKGTPGHWRRGLCIREFDGRPASPAALRRRAWAELISLGALGMGFLWMLVDADHLAWHDHISRTFVAEESTSGS